MGTLCKKAKGFYLTVFPVPDKCESNRVDHSGNLVSAVKFTPNSWCLDRRKGESFPLRISYAFSRRNVGELAP